MRTHYRNGDECSLGNCNGCQMISINGIACHETGCPDAWRDQPKECFECGCEFLRETRHQRTCEDCQNIEPMDEEWDGDTIYLEPDDSDD